MAEPAPEADSRQRRSYGANDRESIDPTEWPPAKVALYAAALELFWQKGFEATSVQEIVELAGLTKGAMYHYFDSKEDLLRVITERSFDVTNVVAHEIAETSASATEAIRRIIAYTVKSIELYQREIGLFFEQWRRRGAEDRLPGTKQKRDEYESVVVRIVEKGIRSGEFKPLEDPRIIAFAIFGLTTHAQNWWRPNDPMTAEQLADFYTELLLNGLSEYAPGTS
jgi:TetR/AcrR family transcriptional regulator, cholesterol catabolism regulator